MLPIVIVLALTEPLNVVVVSTLSSFPPILKAVNDREQGIKNALESAEKAREEIKTLKASNDNVLKEAKIERDNILKEASVLKKSILEEAKTEAKTEAQKIIDNANDSIKNEKEAAVSLSLIHI